MTILAAPCLYITYITVGMPLFKNRSTTLRTLLTTLVLDYSRDSASLVLHMIDYV
jgi:hypothetical protein